MRRGKHWIEDDLGDDGFAWIRHSVDSCIKWFRVWR